MRLDGFGLLVENMAKMIRFYRDVLGFEIKEEELEPWGQRTCYIADPEGNLIEIGSWNKPFEEKDAGR
ncbi:MAG: hypothetical protein E7279_06910 [Lachnospiraceae bacterium]|nr:hypothetical protein [Lachnospiraceae bacterium]